VIAPNGDAIVTGCLHTGMEYDAILTVRYRGSDGSVIWSAKYGDTLAGNSGGTAIAIDASGNVFVTGYTAGASGKQLLVGVKYDGARGAQLWASTFAAYGHAQANAIAVDGNGDVYVTGQSEDPPDANGNIRTVKYGGTTGAQIWTASFDGYGRSGDVGRAIVADAAGHVFVTGGVTPTTGGSNFRTIAYDAATGAQVWTGEVGADGVDSGVDAAIDSDGNVVVAGSTVEAASGGNYRVIQYDSASGAIRWTTAVPGTPAGRGAAQSVGIDASGSVLVTGYSDATHYSMRTVKLDGASGALSWNVAYSGTASDDNYSYALAVDSVGNAVVTGFSSEAGGANGVRTIKYSGPDGRQLWSAGYPSGDAGMAVGLDGNDGVFVAAHAFSIGGYGFRILKYAGDTGALQWATASSIPVIPAESPGSLSGLWWNPAESGWGIDFTQRGNIVFAAWYTYDGAGNPKWYVASRCELPSAAAGGSCTGPLYEVTGPTFFAPPFDPAAVHVAQAGTLRLDFTDANSGSMTYTVAGQTRSVSIERQPLPVGVVPPPVDLTDLWWNPAESGWGLAVTHRYDVMFLAWFEYDGAGKPTWLVASDCAVFVGQYGCSGTLYRTKGPPFAASFDPVQVTAAPVGTVQLMFEDPNNGTLTYTVDGVSGTKSITRQLF